MWHGGSMLSELPHEFSKLPHVLDYFNNRRIQYCKVNGLQKAKTVSLDFFKNLEASIDLPWGMWAAGVHGGQFHKLRNLHRILLNHRTSQSLGTHREWKSAERHLEL